MEADIEVATGFDLWRWEDNLGYHPESGPIKSTSKKIVFSLIVNPWRAVRSTLPNKETIVSRGTLLGMIQVNN